MMKRIFLVGGAIIIGLVAILFVRTLSYESYQGAFAPIRDASTLSEIDSSVAAQRLAKAITFRTISVSPPQSIDTAPFIAFHAWLRETYPRVHQELQHETVNNLSLLYTWEGRDPSLSPILLMGHQDVVPVSPGTEESWAHPPFGGVVADGYVWGRGAIDNKMTVIALLEAAESLLAEGFWPERTIYLAFGHDEELGGANGAAAIADLFKTRNVTNFAFVLDEGGAIAEGLIPGIKRTAMFGMAEKGTVSLKLEVESIGGHSAAPPRSTAIGILSRAITRLENNQFPARIDGATLDMIDFVGRETPFLQRIFTANLWFFGPLIKAMMARTEVLAPMVRTTTAATVFNGGVKDNVLPVTASAAVNFRILPGESVESVVSRVRNVIDDDRIKVSIAFSAARDPSHISNPHGPAFQLLGRSLMEVVSADELIVAPYLSIGGTDAKYYAGHSENVFRFLPIILTEDDLGIMHGTNERLSVGNLSLSIRYYRQVIQNSDELK